MAAALQIWSPTFCKSFDALPKPMQEALLRKIDDMGTRMDSYPHKRLSGRPECKLRVGDYRALYAIDVSAGRLYLHYVGHRREIYKQS